LSQNDSTPLHRQQSVDVWADLPFEIDEHVGVPYLEQKKATSTNAEPIRVKPQKTKGPQTPQRKKRRAEKQAEWRRLHEAIEHPKEAEALQDVKPTEQALLPEQGTGGSHAKNLTTVWEPHPASWPGALFPPSTGTDSANDDSSSSTNSAAIPPSPAIPWTKFPAPGSWGLPPIDDPEGAVASVRAAFTTGVASSASPRPLKRDYVGPPPAPDDYKRVLSPWEIEAAKERAKARTLPASRVLARSDAPELDESGVGGWGLNNSRPDLLTPPPPKRKSRRRRYSTIAIFDWQNSVNAPSAMLSQTKDAQAADHDSGPESAFGSVAEVQDERPDACVGKAPPDIREAYWQSIPEDREQKDDGQTQPLLVNCADLQGVFESGVSGAELSQDFVEAQMEAFVSVKASRPEGPDGLTGLRIKK
ncbi:hypothetical protein LTR28_012854, partial [Elasticomyces elasticus]